MVTNKIFTSMPQFSAKDEACRRVAPFWDREAKQSLKSAKNLNKLLKSLILLAA